jgi:hypothetical protein
MNVRRPIVPSGVEDSKLRQILESYQQAIQTMIDHWPQIPAPPRGVMSIQYRHGVMSLVNDASYPGGSKYYGTDGLDRLGWHDLPVTKCQPPPPPYTPPPLNFSYSVSGNQASVLGGYWRIQGVGEGYANAGTLTAPTGTQATPVLTLPLSQPVEWICVQNSFGASIPTPVITVIHTNRPLANDGGLHTVILARAVSSNNTNWSIVEWGWLGGDIYESAPLPLGP